jgi:hypothetical protein
MYHNCASLCSLCEGKEGEIKFTYHLFLLITGIRTNMLLIIFLGIIAKLTLVLSDCDVGPQDVKDFDFTKVGIYILT